MIFISFGEFSYDDEQPFEAQFFIGSDTTEPELEITAEDGWFELTSFSATVADVSWDLEDAYYKRTSWVTSRPNYSLGGLDFDTPAPFPLAADQWLFGDVRDVLVMVMFSATSADLPTWYQAEDADGFGGTWVAQARTPTTPIPEPTTTLLISSMVLGGGGLLKKRLSAAKAE